MTDWQERSLGEICSFVNGGTPSTKVKRYYRGDIPWITSADLNGNTVSKARLYITHEAIESSATNLVPKGNILLVTRTGVGKVAINEVDICISQDFTAILPDRIQVDVWFLFYFLRAKQEHFVSNQRGATIQGITRKVISDLCVPLPPLDEQKRIAAVLNTADRLRRLRRYALELSEGFLQSVFLDMFGDPVTNPMGWPVVTLGETLSSIDSGWSPKAQERAATITEWGILKLGAVTSCIYQEHENKAIIEGTVIRPELEVHAGDLLFSRKNTYELVGACAYVFNTRPGLMLSDLIFRLNLNATAQSFPTYFWQLLVFPTMRTAVQKLAGGTAGSMPNISKGRLQTVRIPLPPNHIQSRFENIVKGQMVLRSAHLEAIRQADHLFDTLLHQAFRGEL